MIIQILKAIAVIAVNFILYILFGSLVCARKNEKWSLSVTVIVGFFLYYALFALAALPVMLTYRPLSLLVKIWTAAALAIAIASAGIHHRALMDKAGQVRRALSKDRGFYIAAGIILAAMAIVVSITYNFTLDAAYYVANVATSVDTNMINVYDPFTGAWQDHFELRYAFATYSVNDAYLSYITGLPALIETKTVMSSTVMLLVGIMYMWICRFLCKDNRKQAVIMYISMCFINLTFITLYTTSNFLMTRTYEGKSIVGNISVLAVLMIYMMAVRSGMDDKKWIMLFIICLGTATVSSTANMIIPAQLCILFLPFTARRKAFKDLFKLAVCMLPEVIMMLVYVIYVKGYFAIYTYPR